MSSYRKRQIETFHHYLMCQVGRSQQIDQKVMIEYAKGNINARYPLSYAFTCVRHWLLDKPVAEREMGSQLLEEIVAYVVV